ncbi:aconitate hydratase [Paecilomyces lecythidis]
MESPAVPVPLDPPEQPILENLIRIRDGLLLLKQDKSSYIKSRDVIPFYEQVIAEVEKLNNVRKDQGRRRPYNRLDYVLDDCFQLISLLFLTVGRNNEAPAVYSLATTVQVLLYSDFSPPLPISSADSPQRLLDHLEEAGFYSAKDLESITNTLKNMRQTLDRGRETYSPHLLKLLKSRLERCQSLLDKLHEELANLDPELAPTHETLVSVLRSTSAANTRSQFSASEVRSYQEQLKKIEATLKDGNFVGAEGTPLKGQELVKGLLERCWKWSELVLERQGKIDERFREPYERLVEIRNQLDRLSVTQAWSLRETDLFQYQRKLDRIDEARVDGNFVDALGQPADLHAQRTLLYLIRRSYAYIYALLISSEPVSEALLPIYNQLQTLRRCLVELNSIDNMRVDGKFYVGTDIPEGQASVNALLAECYDLVYDLRAALVEKEDGKQSETDA